MQETLSETHYSLLRRREVSSSAAASTCTQCSSNDKDKLASCSPPCSARWICAAGPAALSTPPWAAHAAPTAAVGRPFVNARRQKRRKKIKRAGKRPRRWGLTRGWGILKTRFARHCCRPRWGSRGRRCERDGAIPACARRW
jgi:hypothetical protein